MWFSEMYQKLLEKKTAQLKLKLIAEDCNACNIAHIKVNHIHSSLVCDVTQPPNTRRSEPHEYSANMGLCISWI